MWCVVGIAVFASGNSYRAIVYELLGPLRAWVVFFCILLCGNPYPTVRAETL